MIIIIIYDFCNLALNLAVWQRSAIGRILKNFCISLLLLIFVSLLLGYSEVISGKLVFNRFWKVTIPLILLIMISSLKLIMIKARNSSIWLWICICLVSQVVLLIIYNDFQVLIPELWLFVPLFLIFFSISFYFINNSKLQAGQSLAGLYSSLSFILVLTIQLSSSKLTYLPYYQISFGFSGFALLYWFFSLAVGEFAFDIIFGHLETDYFHYLNPPVKSGIRSSTT